MLKKNVVYLKNIIFIKLLSYVSLITILLAINNVLKDFLCELQKKEENKSYLLAQAEKKLFYIENLNEEVIGLEAKYNKLIGKTSSEENCISKNILINKIKNLENKYNLSKEIDINIFKKLKGSNFKDSDSQFKMNTYELTIKFPVTDMKKFFEISSNIYSILPVNSIIASCEITQSSTFLPKMIKNLSTKKSLDLIYVKMTIYLNDIVCDIKS